MSPSFKPFRNASIAQRAEKNRGRIGTTRPRERFRVASNRDGANAIAVNAANTERPATLAAAIVPDSNQAAATSSAAGPRISRIERRRSSNRSARNDWFHWCRPAPSPDATINAESTSGAEATTRTRHSTSDDATAVADPNEPPIDASRPAARRSLITR